MRGWATAISFANKSRYKGLHNSIFFFVIRRINNMKQLGIKYFMVHMIRSISDGSYDKEQNGTRNGIFSYGNHTAREEKNNNICFVS